MNNSAQAQNGFKTFILTLSISLLVFSVVYYFVTDSKKIDIESTEIGANVKGAQTANVSSTPTPTASVSNGKTTSAFGKLAVSKPNTQARAVLAGAATATPQTTSSVPQTGSTEITIAFFLSMAVLAFGVFVVYAGPRKAALHSFEDEVTKGL